MKVLFFNSLYFPNVVGGAERSTQILAEGLVAAGIKAAVVSTAETDSHDVVNGVSANYIRTPNLYWVRDAGKAHFVKKAIWHTRDANNRGTYSLVRPIIEQERPDLIHTNNLAGLSSAIWKIAQTMGIPVVHTIRDMYLCCLKSTMFRNEKNCRSQCFSCRLFSRPKKKLSQSVRSVVGISRYILNWHLQHGYFSSAHSASCIANPVAASQPSIRQAGIHSPVTFGFAGALSPHKGVGMLLQTATGMTKGDFRLKIYGAARRPGYDSYLRSTYSDPRIEYCGQCPPERIFPSIDVNIVPSLWHEPFGRVVPEGFSYGVPAIVSNRGGLPEIVSQDETGFVFDPDRPDDLRDRMQSLIDRPELIERMRANCMKQVVKYTVDGIVKKYVEVYERTLK